MNSSEHIREAERWLEIAKDRYQAAGSSPAEKSQAAAMIARTHAILAVQLLNPEDEK